MTDKSKASLWQSLKRWALPRMNLTLYGDRDGLCGADAAVLWLGRAWLRQNLEERPQHG
jgi:hypothetical protein